LQRFKDSADISGYAGVRSWGDPSLRLKCGFAQDDTRFIGAAIFIIYSNYLRASRKALKH
jgi:hypothetical protein